MFQLFKITPPKSQQNKVKFVVWCIGVEMSALGCGTMNWSSCGTDILLIGPLGSGMGSNTHCASPKPGKSMALKRFTTYNQNAI